MVIRFNRINKKSWFRKSFTLYFQWSDIPWQRYILKPKKLITQIVFFFFFFSEKCILCIMSKWPVWWCRKFSTKLFSNNIHRQLILYVFTLTIFSYYFASEKLLSNLLNAHIRTVLYYKSFLLYQDDDDENCLFEWRQRQ